MAKRKRDENLDRAEPLSPAERVLETFVDLIPDSGPLMVTAWVGFVEFIDDDGVLRVSAVGSDTAWWRMRALIDAGTDMFLGDE